MKCLVKGSELITTIDAKLAFRKLTSSFALVKMASVSDVSSREATDKSASEKSASRRFALKKRAPRNLEALKFALVPSETHQIKASDA